jgi:uncharacterized iron-regulated membrane protein
MSVERFLRSLHGWLGVCILPWVVIAGFTGFYMNHSKLILSLMPDTGYDVAQMDQSALAQPVDAVAAHALAVRVLPNIAPTLAAPKRFMGREAYRFDGGETDVWVDRATGHYWVTGRYVTRTYAPDGTRLATELRWSRVLSSLHTRGWIGTALGSFLADATAIALTIFGASGLYVFLAPRFRRAKNRRARLKTTRG